MENKIKKIMIWEEHNENFSGCLVAKIRDNEDLELEGCDTGNEVKIFWGDDDYKYWLSVSKEYKDTVLLWLIKEKFDTTSGFQEWLNEKGVPSKFDNWV